VTDVLVNVEPGAGDTIGGGKLLVVVELLVEVLVDALPTFIG
jgi:hypothetical protein